MSDNQEPDEQMLSAENSLFKRIDDILRDSERAADAGAPYFKVTNEALFAIVGASCETVGQKVLSRIQRHIK